MGYIIIVFVCGILLLGFWERIKESFEDGTAMRLAVFFGVCAIACGILGLLLGESFWGISGFFIILIVILVVLQIGAFIFRL